MNKKLQSLIALTMTAAVLLCAVPSAFAALIPAVAPDETAAGITLYAMEDIMLRSGNANYYGDIRALEIKGPRAVASGTTGAFTGGVKFDLSALSGKVIQSAKLRVTSEIQKSANKTARLYTLSSNWTENRHEDDSFDTYDKFATEIAAAKLIGTQPQYGRYGSTAEIWKDSRWAASTADDWATILADWQTEFDVTSEIASNAGASAFSFLLTNEDQTGSDPVQIWGKDYTGNPRNDIKNLRFAYNEDGTVAETIKMAYPQLIITYAEADSNAAKAAADFAAATAAVDALNLNYSDIKALNNLPTSAANGSAITWTSSNPAIVITDNTAVITPQEADCTGDVRVTVTLGDAVLYRDYSMTVTPTASPDERITADQAEIQAALDALDGTGSTYSWTLPITGTSGSSVSYQFNPASAVSFDANTGAVTLNRFTLADVNLDITATLQLAGAAENKTALRTRIAIAATNYLIPAEDVTLRSDQGNTNQSGATSSELILGANRNGFLLKFDLTPLREQLSAGKILTGANLAFTKKSGGNWALGVAYIPDNSWDEARATYNNTIGAEGFTQEVLYTPTEHGEERTLPLSALTETFLRHSNGFLSLYIYQDGTGSNTASGMNLYSSEAAGADITKRPKLTFTFADAPAGVDYAILHQGVTAEGKTDILIQKYAGNAEDYLLIGFYDAEECLTGAKVIPVGTGAFSGPVCAINDIALADYNAASYRIFLWNSLRKVIPTQITVPAAQPGE